MAFKDKRIAEQKKKRRDGILGLIITFLVLIPVLALMLPTVIFLFLAMLPTFIALLADKRARYKWLCIGGMNFAGTLYFLFKLLIGEPTIAYALFIFFKIETVLIVYGAAAFGYCLYKIVPVFVINFQSLSNQHRLNFLRNAQKNLIEQWGAEVSDGVPPHK